MNPIQFSPRPPRVAKTTAPVKFSGHDPLEFAKQLVNDAYQANQIVTLAEWLCTYRHSPLYEPRRGLSLNPRPIPQAITAANGALVRLVKDLGISPEQVAQAKKVIDNRYRNVSQRLRLPRPLYDPPKALLDAFDKRLNKGISNALHRDGTLYEGAAPPVRRRKVPSNSLIGFFPY